MNVEMVRPIFQQVFGHGPADPPVETVDDMVSELGEVVDELEEPLRANVEGMLLTHALEQALNGAFEKPRLRRKAMDPVGFKKPATQSLHRGHSAARAAEAKTTGEAIAATLRAINARYAKEVAEQKARDEEFRAWYRDRESRTERAELARAVRAEFEAAKAAQSAEEAKEVPVSEKRVFVPENEVEFCRKAAKVSPEGALSREVVDGHVVVHVKGGRLEFGTVLNKKSLRQAARNINVAAWVSQLIWMPTRFIPDPSE